MRAALQIPYHYGMMDTWNRRMDMKVSTKGRYALRLMIDLAEHDRGDYIPLKEISARQNVSVKYLEQIVNQLSRAGLLRSVRGAQGGYRLAKDPEDYTAGEILRVTEGGLAPIACLSEAAEACPRGGECETLDFWIGLAGVIDRYVDGVSLADLVRQHQGKLNTRT